MSKGCGMGFCDTQRPQDGHDDEISINAVIGLIATFTDIGAKIAIESILARYAGFRL